MFPLAFVAGWLQGHGWGFISRNYIVWPTFYLMNVFIALKGSHFWFLLKYFSIRCEELAKLQSSCLYIEIEQIFMFCDENFVMTEMILSVRHSNFFLRTWTVGPQHDKTSKMSVRPAKTQICPVWSESLLALSGWLSTQAFYMLTAKTDQTGRMPRLIWVFAGRTAILLVLSWGSSVSTVMTPSFWTDMSGQTM